MKITIIRTALCCLCLLLGACEKKDLLVNQREEGEGGVRTMGDFIRNNYDLSLLAAALERVNLLDSLDMPGPFTILAPDNEAFNQSGITKPEDFDRMNVDSLRFILKYHILPLRLYTSDIPAQLDNTYATLAGPDVYLSAQVNNPVFYSQYTANGALVRRAPRRDQPLINGALHVVNKLMKYQPLTIQEFLASNADLSLFVTAMKRFRLWDQLNAQGPLTVYAPVNDAFLKYGLTADSINRMDPQDYDPVLFGIYPVMLTRRHLFSSDIGLVSGEKRRVTVNEVYSFSPSDGGISLYEGENYSDDGPSGVDYAHGGYANGADYTLNNGIAHLVNDLFLYPDSLRIR